MGTSMEKIRELVDVNTIIGDPITSPDGTIIIPVSKVSFGFVAGGSDLPTKAPKEVFAGGSGAGKTDAVLHKLCSPATDWKPSKRFSGNPSAAELKNWLLSLGI